MSLRDRVRGMMVDEAVRRHDQDAPSSNVVALREGVGILARPSIYLRGSGRLRTANEKFNQWRPYQESAVLSSLDSDKRFKIQCMPTGAGKTLTYVMEAILSGEKAVILTSTKGLQDQLMADFIEIGMVDVRGKSNYACLALEPKGELRDVMRVTGTGWTVDEGPCHFGMQCSLRGSGCTHYDAVRVAKSADLVVTNYAWWLSQSNMKIEDRIDGPENKIGLLILDEAHKAADELCGFLEVEISWEELRLAAKTVNVPFDLDEMDALGTWHDWCLVMAARLNSWMEERSAGEVHADGADGIRRVQKIKKAMRKIESIAGIGKEEDWIMEPKIEYGGARAVQKVTGVKFSPVWPAPYAERLLFRSVPKVVLSSATVRMKSAELLGIDKNQVVMFESPSSFPIERRPIYVPPSVQMNYRNEQNQAKMKRWMRTFDKIVEDRKDRKGIVHTVSYKRRNFVTAESSNRGLMRTHSNLDARAVIDQFKTSSSGLLVSPSSSTGYDFPFKQCEYQIICKIPFPDSRSEIMKRRQKLDPEYGKYYAMQELMQMTGRGMRADDDQCETFVLDDNMKWFVRQNRHLAAKWWLDAVKFIGHIPKPLPKLK